MLGSARGGVFLTIIPALLVFLLIPVTAQAETIDEVPTPAGFTGPAPICNCSAGGVSQSVYHNPSTMAARMAYNRGDGWQAVEFDGLAAHLGDHPTELGCASFVTDDGQVRSIITYMGRDISGGFGMYTLVVDFPPRKDPIASDVIAHILYPTPGVDVASSSVDYDRTTGRIVAAGISGAEITYFNAGLDAADLILQPLPDLSAAYTSADFPKNQVDVSAKTPGEIFVIIFDRGDDRIFYRTSLDGLTGVTNMVSGTRIEAMEGTSGSGPATVGVEVDPFDHGIWITYRDKDGTIKRVKLSIDSEIRILSVARRGDHILVFWCDKKTGACHLVVYDAVSGKAVSLDFSDNDLLTEVEVNIGLSGDNPDLSAVTVTYTNHNYSPPVVTSVTYTQNEDGSFGFNKQN